MKPAVAQRINLYLLNLIGRFFPSVAGAWAVLVFSTPKRFPRSEWEEELIKAAKPIAFKTGLRGWEWGSGPTILLVHGWQGRGTQLGALVLPLIEDGHRVVALDGPAHGSSPGRRTNVRAFGLSIKRVVFELGKVKAIVAHSFGASATAVAVAEAVPVERVVLVAAPVNPQDVIDLFKRRLRLSRRVGRSFQRKLERWAGAKAKHLHVGRIGAKVSVPALIVHDRQDKEVPFENAERIVARWKTARLCALDGKGHRRILRDPEFISAVREFLRF